MGVPKRKVSKARKRKRRTHDGVEAPARSTCPRCHQVKLPHRPCPNCGFYKGKDVLELE